MLIPAGRSATVHTPATTANLGPGFDSLGLALDWVDQASVDVIESGYRFALSGDGADALPRDASHLVLKTILRGLEELDATVPGLSFTAHNTIPLARGLGSSSAAISAGLALAWGLSYPERPLDRDWAFGVAVDIEGHPDNVGPAIFGGLTIGWLRQGTWQIAQATVRDDIRITALVPSTVLETEKARAAMPASIPLEDAIANSAHTALLMHAFASAPELLLDGTSDRLHQEYRRSLYPVSLTLVEHLRGQGLAACISGAGPTVVVFHSSNQGALVDLTLEAAAGDPRFAGFTGHSLRIGDGVQLVS